MQEEIITTTTKQKRKLWMEGHRGAGLLVYENTIEAFQKAIDLKLNGIEFDIWKTTDNEIVVYHGGKQGQLKLPGLEETCVNQLDLLSIQQIKMNEIYRIPTLREVMHLCKDKIHLNIEFKQCDMSIEVLKLVQEFGMENQVNFSSFFHQVQMELKMAARVLNYDDSLIKFGYLFEKTELDFQILDAVENRVDYHVNINESDASSENLSIIKQKGFNITIWFCMDQEESIEIYQRLYLNGVDRIITNYPHMLIDFVGQLAAS